MLSFRQEKSNQICLIENDRTILWTEEFRRAMSGDVSNDGTVAIHDVNPEPLVNNKAQVTYQLSHSLIVIQKDSCRFKLDFGTQAEVISFKLSQDGTLLVYNLQKYHPNDYRLVLHKLATNKEEWRYKYPQDQVVHELEFNQQRILAYSGLRPSAYVDRQYSFTLDLAGKLVENDAAESQKQKERDSTAALAKNAADRVIQILTANLAEVTPTIEAESKSEYGTRSVSLGMTSIMRGERILPALYIQVCPTPQDSKFKRETSNTEETTRKFFLHIEVIAESIEKRDETVGKCLKTLTRNEEEFVRNNLAITTTPQTWNIPLYSGGGPYLRARISTIVAFPSKEG